MVDQRRISANQRARRPARTSATAQNLGAALRHLGDWPQAVRVWRHGAALDPGHAGLAMELALAYLAAPMTAVRDAEKGLEFAERAARLDPHRPDPGLAGWGWWRATAPLRPFEPPVRREGSVATLCAACC